ncbi:MAG: AraC family transcriptional regulator [Acidobacteria bacterium]|nr:AraC family transcriptional regulator [Acidobacteriota bacterium]
MTRSDKRHPPHGAPNTARASVTTGDAATTDKVFVAESYAIHLRRARALRWSSAASPAYNLLFVLSGAARVVSESGADAPPSPFTLLAAPGDALEARAPRADALGVTLAPGYLLDCALRARLTRDDALVTFTRPHVRDGNLDALARALAAELRAEEAGQELIVSALVEQIAVQLLRRHANVRRSRELELSRAGLVDRRVRRAVELMHAHLERELPLEALASAAYLSPFHFARLFKKVTGASPHAYLAALRIERAKRLLAASDFSVTEIAQRVGYATSSHFAKAFRQSTGLTPRAFRTSLVSRHSD